MTVEISFVSKVPDRTAFQGLLFDYYAVVLPAFEKAGGPHLDPQEYAKATMDDLDQLLPPDGRLALAHDASGQLVGCATLRRIRADAVEMKRMFVKPQVQGTGLGKRLFDIRIAEARAMGCRHIYADTIKGNRPMLRIYEKYGFQYIPRYPENANPPEYAPFLAFLTYQIPD